MAKKRKFNEPQHGPNPKDFKKLSRQRPEGETYIAIVTHQRQYKEIPGKKNFVKHETRWTNKQGEYVSRINLQNVRITQRTVYVKVDKEILADQNKVREIVNKKINRAAMKFQKTAKDVEGKVSAFDAQFRIISGKVLDKYTVRMAGGSKSTQTIRTKITGVGKPPKSKVKRKGKKLGPRIANAKREALDDLGKLLTRGFTNTRKRKGSKHSIRYRKRTDREES